MSNTTKIKGGLQLEAVDINSISNPKNNQIVLDSNDSKLKKYNESLDLWEEIASGVVCSGPNPVVFNIANNQTTPQNITDLIVDTNEATTFDVEYVIRRSTDDNSVSQKGVYSGIYDLNDNVWYTSDTFSGINAGVDFSINNSTGQISYISTNISGTNYEGNISYILKTNKACAINIGGDVTGALNQTKVEAIQNIPVPAPIAGDDGKALIYDHASGDFIYGEADASLPTTTKGDLLVHDGSDNTRLPIGTNGQLLQADSTQGEGMLWADRPANFNYVINGNFDFWQRGTSLSAATNYRYLADRFVFGAASSTTIATSRQSFTLGQTDVPNEPTHFIRNVVVSGGLAGSAANGTHAIEDVRTLAGQTATLSFYAKADSNKYMAIEFNQVFGTGGSPSATVRTLGGKISLTSSWQKFIITVSIPSISGKTIGSNGNSHLGIIFWLDAGSNFDARTDSLGNQSGTFDIAQVKLEKGSYATDFTLAGGNLAGELAMCQRYYEKSYEIYTNPGTNTSLGAVGFNLPLNVPNGNSIRFNQGYAVVKRATPTVTLYGQVSGNTGVIEVGDVDRTATVVSASTTMLCLGLSNTSGVTWSAGASIDIHYTADAEL